MCFRALSKRDRCWKAADLQTGEQYSKMSKRKEKKHFLATTGLLKIFRDIHRIPTLREWGDHGKNVPLISQFFIQNNTKNLNMIRWYDKMITNPNKWVSRQGYSWSTKKITWVLVRFSFISQRQHHWESLSRTLLRDKAAEALKEASLITLKRVVSSA